MAFILKEGGAGGRVKERRRERDERGGSNSTTDHMWHKILKIVTLWPFTEKKQKNKNPATPNLCFHLRKLENENEIKAKANKMKKGKKIRAGNL